jgi:hypothetical protein
MVKLGSLEKESLTSTLTKFFLVRLDSLIHDNEAKERNLLYIVLNSLFVISGSCQEFIIGMDLEPYDIGLKVNLPSLGAGGYIDRFILLFH